MTVNDAIERGEGDNEYKRNIVRAAHALMGKMRACNGQCACPRYYDYKYITQYVSGTTVWGDPDGDSTVSVTTGSEIIDFQYPQGER